MNDADRLPSLYRNPLLATQGTEYDAGAERVALALAARCGVPLGAVLPLVSNPEFEMLAPMQENAAEAGAAAALRTLRERAAAMGVESECRVRRGEEPYREIVAEARERRSDLVILRRRGRRGLLANLLLGEMVHTVTGHVPCDVLIVPQAGELWSRKVLLATDGSPHSERAARQAAAVCLCFGLPLHVVSVAAGEDRGSAAAARADVDRAVGAARAAGVAEADGAAATGRPPEAILAAAESVGADCIVIGRRGLNTVKRMLVGSNSEQVAGRADCPVLIVREEPGQA